MQDNDKDKSPDSISRSVRIKIDDYEKILEYAEADHRSFSNAIQVLIQLGLQVVTKADKKILHEVHE